MSSRFRQILATSLAVILGVVAGVDIVGTPLAIVAIKHAEGAAQKANRASHQAEHYAHAIDAAQVKARENDCRQQNQVREVTLLRIARSLKEDPQTLRLLHIPETPELDRALHKSADEERALVRLIDCTHYGREAIP